MPISPVYRPRPIVVPGRQVSTSSAPGDFSGMGRGLGNILDSLAKKKKAMAKSQKERAEKLQEQVLQDAEKQDLVELIDKSGGLEKEAASLLPFDILKTLGAKTLGAGMDRKIKDAESNRQAVAEIEELNSRIAQILPDEGVSPAQAMPVAPASRLRLQSETQPIKRQRPNLRAVAPDNRNNGQRWFIDMEKATGTPPQVQSLPSPKSTPFTKVADRIRGSGAKKLFSALTDSTATPLTREEMQAAEARQSIAQTIPQEMDAVRAFVSMDEAQKLEVIKRNPDFTNKVQGQLERMSKRRETEEIDNETDVTLSKLTGIDPSIVNALRNSGNADVIRNKLPKEFQNIKTSLSVKVADNGDLVAVWVDENFNSKTRKVGEVFKEPGPKGETFRVHFNAYKVKNNLDDNIKSPDDLPPGHKVGFSEFLSDSDPLMGLLRDKMGGGVSPKIKQKFGLK